MPVRWRRCAARNRARQRVIRDGKSATVFKRTYVRGDVVTARAGDVRDLRPRGPDRGPNGLTATSPPLTGAVQCPVTIGFRGPTPTSPIAQSLLGLQERIPAITGGTGERARRLRDRLAASWRENRGMTAEAARGGDATGETARTELAPQPRGGDYHRAGGRSRPWVVRPGKEILVVRLDPEDRNRRRIRVARRIDPAGA